MVEVVWSERMTSTTLATTKECGTFEILKADIRGRIRIPAGKREEILREYDRSGMSGAEFAKWVGMKYTTFAGWIQRRGRDGKRNPVKTVKWMEAVVTGAKIPEVGIVMHLPGGIRVETCDGKAAGELLKGLGVKTC